MQLRLQALSNMAMIAAVFAESYTLFCLLNYACTDFAHQAHELPADLYMSQSLQTQKKSAGFMFTKQKSQL